MSPAFGSNVLEVEAFPTATYKAAVLLNSRAGAFRCGRRAEGLDYVGATYNGAKGAGATARGSAIRSPATLTCSTWTGPGRHLCRAARPRRQGGSIRVSESASHPGAWASRSALTCDRTDEGERVKPVLSHRPGAAMWHRPSGSGVPASPLRVSTKAGPPRPDRNFEFT